MSLHHSLKFVFVKALLFAAVAGPGAAGAAEGNLYLVAAGISEVPGQQPLPSCRKDGLAMVEWARSQQGRLFRDVDAVALIDGDATGRAIGAALDRVRANARPGDYSIVYLSSHGVCGRDGQFYFVAVDGVIPWEAFRAALRDVPGTVIVIIDACQCGGAAGDNLVVLSASLRHESSVGFDSYDRNSLFTEHLLAGLTGAADFNRNGTVTITEVEAYVSNQLAERNATVEPGDRQTMTVTRPGNVPSDLPLASLAAQAAPALNLSGTTWDGSEELGTYGRLSFQFLAGGRAVMIDAQSRVEGSYTVSGDTVTLNFPGSCSYSGTLEGNTLRGRGQDDTRTWPFEVTKTE